MSRPRRSRRRPHRLRRRSGGAVRSSREADRDGARAPRAAGPEFEQLEQAAIERSTRREEVEAYGRTETLRAKLFVKVRGIPVSDRATAMKHWAIVSIWCLGIVYDLDAALTRALDILRPGSASRSWTSPILGPLVGLCAHSSPSTDSFSRRPGSRPPRIWTTPHSTHGGTAGGRCCGLGSTASTNEPTSEEGASSSWALSDV